MVQPSVLGISVPSELRSIREQINDNIKNREYPRHEIIDMREWITGT